MAKASFAPPKSAKPFVQAEGDDQQSNWLNTVDGEMAFFRTLIDCRPVGSAKHWTMIDLTLRLKKTAPEVFHQLGVEEPWKKYNEVYNSKFLHEDPTKAGDTDSAEAQAATPTDKDDAAPVDGFESAEFSLEPLARLDPAFADLKHDRCLRGPDDPVSPEPSPLRDFPLYHPPAAATKAGAAATKKKRIGADEDHADGPAAKKVASAPAAKQDDQSSDVSELTDLEDEAEEKSEVEEEQEDEETSESGGGDDYKDSPSASASAAQSPDARSQIRALPSSKTTASRSRTKAAPESTDKKASTKKRAGRRR
ncbi:hypothetical protein RQP46_005985 [Phenoliferia psychrophenolica]